MTRRELHELIKQEITTAAFNELKNKGNSEPEPKQNANEPKDYHVPGKTLARKELSEEEIDDIMFGEKKKKRGKNKVERKTTIMENANRNPQITVSEVHTFEDNFEKMIAGVPNASVAFDKQARDPRQRSLVLVRRPDGIDAIASGTITVGKQGTVKWNFSLFGGLQMETVGKFDMEKETQYLFDNLYTHYNEWQSEWREKLTTSPDEAEADMGEEMTDIGAEGGEEMSDIPMQGGQAGTPEATSL